MSKSAWLLEQFSIECWKPKTEEILAANQNKVYIVSSQWGLKVKTSLLRMLEARENANDQVAMYLIFVSGHLNLSRESSI